MGDMNPRGPHICPRCGERVSAFAAGCAICGAELDPKRAVGAQSLAERLRRQLRLATRRPFRG